MNERTITRALNEKQFAAAVGLSYGTVKRMRQRGLIKHCRVGRRIIYRPEHIDVFLGRFEQPNNAPS